MTRLQEVMLTGLGEPQPYISSAIEGIEQSPFAPQFYNRPGVAAKHIRTPEVAAVVAIVGPGVLDTLAARRSTSLIIKDFFGSSGDRQPTEQERLTTKRAELETFLAIAFQQRVPYLLIGHEIEATLASSRTPTQLSELAAMEAGADVSLAMRAVKHEVKYDTEISSQVLNFLGRIPVLSRSQTPIPGFRPGAHTPTELSTAQTGQA